MRTLIGAVRSRRLIQAYSPALASEESQADDVHRNYAKQQLFASDPRESYKEVSALTTSGVFQAMKRAMLRHLARRTRHSYSHVAHSVPCT
jgi:hypothetical protein